MARNISVMMYVFNKCRPSELPNFNTPIFSRTNLMPCSKKFDLLRYPYQFVFVSMTSPQTTCRVHSLSVIQYPQLLHSLGIHPAEPWALGEDSQWILTSNHVLFCINMLPRRSPSSRCSAPNKINRAMKFPCFSWGFHLVTGMHTEDREEGTSRT